VLSLPIPLRLLLAAQPQLLTPVLQVVHRVLTRYLLERARLKSSEGRAPRQPPALRQSTPGWAMATPSSIHSPLRPRPARPRLPRRPRQPLGPPRWRLH